MLTLAFMVMCCGGAFAQSNVVSLNSSPGQQWLVKPASEVNETLKQADQNTTAWVPAIVPGTTFASYVAAGQEKDPNFGDNIYKVDVKSTIAIFGTVPNFMYLKITAKKTTWLNFQGVNRKADIYLNGTLLGSLDGFMQRGQFDITELVKGKKKTCYLYWFISPNSHWPMWVAPIMYPAPAGIGCLMYRA
jgi:beta-galactosidase/beta-glucuronidase